MIRLHVGDEKGYYHLLGGIPFGPLATNGLPLEDVIEFRHPNDFISQGHEILGEKSVAHQKYEGDFYVNPSIENATQTPKDTTTGWSYIEWRFRWWRTIDGRYFQISVRDGFNYGSGGKIYYQGDFVWHWFTTISPTKVIYRRLSRSHWGFWIASEDEYIVKSYDASRVYYKQYSRRSRSELVKYPLTYYPDHALKEHWDNVMASPDMDYYNTSDDSTTSRYTSEQYRTLVSPSKIKDMIVSTSYESKSVDTQNLPSTLTSYELVAKAIGNLDAVDTNLIAFVRDLKDIKSLVPKLRELRKLKTHASNHLAVQYGILPTISDLQEIIGALKKASQFDKQGRKLGYSLSSGNIKYTDRQGIQINGVRQQRVKIALSPQDSSLNTFLESLENWGFGLNFKNIWDLIPYSFVIDWFVDIGDFLSDIDTRMRLARLPIEYITYSDKIETSHTLAKPAGFPAVQGMLKRVSYRRHVTTEVPRQDFKLDKGSGLTPHWLEASALVLQRTK